MELLFFMGLVTPLIQFCRVISSGMVEPSRSQSSLDEYCLICRVLSSLGVYRRPYVSPNAPMFIQYYVIHVSTSCTSGLC